MRDDWTALPTFVAVGLGFVLAYGPLALKHVLPVLGMTD